MVNLGVLAWIFSGLRTIKVSALTAINLEGGSMSRVSIDNALLK